MAFNKITNEKLNELIDEVFDEHDYLLPKALTEEGRRIVSSAALTLAGRVVREVLIRILAMEQE